MAAVSDSTQSSGLTQLQALMQDPNATSASSANGVASAASTQDRFLTLLVAQMKNQDPMNPMDNAQVTSQLAQISTVQGVEQLNTTMSKFADQNSKSRAIDSASLIGQSVLSDGSTINLASGHTGAIQAGVNLSADADKVKVDLVDASGAVVDSKTFSDQKAGTISLQWSGTSGSGAGTALPAGKYTMVVTATSGTSAVTATALTTSAVTGVTQGSSGVSVALANGGSVNTDDIKGVFRP